MWDKIYTILHSNSTKAIHNEDKIPFIVYRPQINTFFYSSDI